MPDINDDFEKRHRKNLKNYKSRIEQVYDDAIDKVSRAGAGAALPNGAFDLSRMPVLNNRINEVLAQMRVNIQTIIVNGVSTEWDLSAGKNNLFVDQRLSKWLKETPLGATFYDPNSKAMEAFVKRKVKGLGLSERVWNSVKGYKSELEAGLGLGISTGKSATAMARDLKGYLNHPDSLFHRVSSIDKDGKKILKLSKAAQDFHPGQGVYRSSYKNALRLTGTETNMAYRAADHERWKTLPFVIGQEIRLSNQHPQYDICDRCAGRYPKEFIFMGWHPQCICYKVPVMMSDEDYEKYEDSLLEGKSPRVRSADRVNDVPEGFKLFLKEQADRISGWKNPPYWVRDNFKKGLISEGLKFKTTPEALPVAEYLMDPDAITRLKAMGVEFENQSLVTNPFNSKLKGFDMEQLFKDFDEIGKEHGIRWTKKLIQGTGQQEGTFITTRHLGITKYGEVYIERNFRTLKGKTEVYHAYFKIPPQLQGAGMSKQVLSKYYEQYKAAGISTVKVTANIDVGGYTWAKYGFSSTKPGELLGIFNSRAFVLTEEQREVVKNLISAHVKQTPNAPFPMRRIADLGQLDGSMYGKKFLLGTWWSGELNLADDATRSIFEDYLYGKTKKK